MHPEALTWVLTIKPLTSSHKDFEWKWLQIWPADCSGGSPTLQDSYCNSMVIVVKGEGEDQ